jgi:periplasmic protein TonB
VPGSTVSVWSPLVHLAKTNEMAMDQTEKMGLGVAVGGHVVLLGAMALGLLMSAERLKRPEPIAVSLVGEIAEVSTAPDAIQEESAPPAAAQAEPADPPPAPTPVMKIEKPVEKPQVKPVEKPVKREVLTPAKTAVKKMPVKQPPVKTAAATKSGKGTTPARPGGLSKSFEDSINNVGKAPGAGKAVGTPAAKSGAEVRRSVSASLASQIRSRVRACAPSGVEINQIETFVTLNLEPSGRLTNVQFNKQIGVNDSNRPQADPLKQCILQSVRAASPFSGLDPEYHDLWKSHALRLRATG